MNDLYRQAVSLSFFAKGAAASVGVLIIHAAFRVLEKTLPLRFGRADARYKVRKLIVFSGYFSILLFLAFLFEDRLGRLSFAFGIAGAGVAIALQDVLASIAGAFSIGFSKLYAVGHRVQIGDTRGDVIDIGLLRTTLLETGNWVSGDLYNGRIVRVPNSTVLRGTVFNYSQGFRFIWDEIKVLFTTTRLPVCQGDAFAGSQRGEWRVPSRGADLLERNKRQLSKREPSFGTYRGTSRSWQIVGIYGQLRG
jgi:small-conductance mechanosensitive channel